MSEPNQWDSKKTVAGRALEAMKYGVNLPPDEEFDPSAVAPWDSCPDCGGLGGAHSCRTCNPRLLIHRTKEGSDG